MKTAYFGYDFFVDCLHALLSQGAEVKWVFSFKTDDFYTYNRRLLQTASDIGATIVLSPPSAQTIEMLWTQGCERIICAGYPYKIPPLNDTTMRGINIHPTLLPEGRGNWPLPWIIIKSLPRSGVSVHKLSPQWDCGDVLMQRDFPLDPRENLETLSCKVQMLAREMMPDLWRQFDMLWDSAEPQSQGSYWPMPTAPERTLHWDRGVEFIDRIARAFGKFDSIAEFDGRQWLVQDLTAWKCAHDRLPGEVTHRSDREVVIAASDGLVCLRAWHAHPNAGTG